MMMYSDLSIWQGVEQFHLPRLVVLNQVRVLQEAAERGYLPFLGLTVYQETHSSEQHCNKHKYQCNMELFYTHMSTLHPCTTS
jgi:hypothetical protein